MAGLYGSLMVRTPRRALAAVLVAATLTTACSSTLAGTATTVSVASTTAARAPSSGPATSANGPSGITVPSSGAPSTGTSPGTPAAGPSAAAGTIGAAGIGDPYYPTAGNGGYQVDSYKIDLDYDPDSNDLRSTALITGTITSTDGRTQFNLDLQPTMTVTDVTVDGATAKFDHQDAELVVTPAAPLV